MCCGQPEDGPNESEIVMANVAVPPGHYATASDLAAAIERAVMVPLYTQLRGDEITIGNYGLARNTEPCWVPESVAVEMAQDEDMHKRLGPAPLAPVAAETEAPTPVDAVDDDEDKPPRRRGRR